MTPEQAAALREEFPPEVIGKLPKVNCKACVDANKKEFGTTCQKHTKINCKVCGNWITEKHKHLDYVGHAACTDRLLQVDPEWTWEFVPEYPMTPAGLWIKLTIGGVSRYGFGDGKSPKEMIGDAIRNAAMRFGVALDLWAKEDLHASESAGAGEGPRQVDETRPPAPAPSDVRKAPALASRTSEPVAASSPSPAQVDGAATDPFIPPQSQLDTYHSRCTALAAAGTDIFAARKNAKLPPLSKIVEEAEWIAWGRLLADLETEADKQAVSA